MLDRIECALNRIADQDWSWWPFLSLKPRPDELLSSIRVAELSLPFGLSAGLLITVMAHLFRIPPSIPATLVYLFSGYLAYFLIFRLVFATCWNRRARRLRRQNGA